MKYWGYILCVVLLLAEAKEMHATEDVGGAVVETLLTSQFETFGRALNLSISHSMAIPSQFTVLVPSDQALSRLPYMSDSIIKSHIVPVRYSYNELLSLSSGVYIPTLTAKSIIHVRNNGSFVSLNGVPLVTTDISESSDFSIHGLDSVLHIAYDIGEELAEDDGPLFISPLFLPYINRAALYNHFGVTNASRDSQQSAPPPLVTSKSKHKKCVHIHPSSKGFRLTVTWVGFATSVFLYSAPLIACLANIRKAWKMPTDGPDQTFQTRLQGIMDRLNGLGFCSVLGNCLFSVVYNLIECTINRPIIVMNGVGALVQVCYLLVYFRGCQRQRIKKKMIAIFFGIFCLLFPFPAFWALSARKFTPLRVGYVIVATFMYGYPLEQLYTSWKANSIENFPVLIMIASLCRAGSWFAYGYRDIYQMVANGCGILFGMILLVGFVKVLWTSK